MSRIKELRIKKKYSQKKMEELTGINQANYCKIEKGTRHLNLKQAIKLSKVLETSIDYLTGLSDSPEPYRPRTAGENGPEGNVHYDGEKERTKK